MVDALQFASRVEFDRAVIILDRAAHGDVVALRDGIGARALHAVAHDRLVGHAFDDDRHGDVVVVRIERRVDLRHFTRQRVLVRQRFAGFQSVRGVDDLFGRLVRLIGVGRIVFARAGHEFVERAARVKLHGAVVVLQRTGHGDRVADLDFIGAIALHSEALDGFVGHTADHDRHGDVVVVRIERRVDLCDLTRQRVVVRQRLAGFQSVRRVDDLRRRFVRLVVVDLAVSGHEFVKRASRVEFDRTVVVFQHTGDGDRVGHLDGVHALALHAVAHDRLVGHTVDHHCDGDVVEAGIVRRIDLRDLTRQGVFIGQRRSLLEFIRRIDDLLRRLVRLVDLAVADFVDAHQRAARGEFARAVVVDQRARYGDDVGDLDGVRALALHAVAQHGVRRQPVDDDGDRNVVVACVIRRVDRGDLTGQRVAAGQRIARFQSVERFEDLLGRRRDRQVLADLVDAHQRTARGELDRAVVVGQDPVDGDRIAALDLIGAVALHTVADDRLVGHIADHDRDRDIVVTAVIRRVDLGDLAGQREGVGQSLAGTERIRRVDDVLGRQFAADNGDRIVLVCRRTAAGRRDRDLHVDVALAGRDRQLAAVKRGNRAVGDLPRKRDLRIKGARHGQVYRRLRVDDRRKRQLGKFQIHLLAVVELYLFIDVRQLAAGSEFVSSVVVGKRSGDGDLVAFHQRLDTLTAQAVAHDRHIGIAADHDRDGDVAVSGIVRGVDLGDHTGQREGAFQFLAGFERIQLIEHVLLADDLISEFDGRREFPAGNDALQLEFAAGAAGVHLNGRLVLFKPRDNVHKSFRTLGGPGDIHRVSFIHRGGRE